MKFRPVLVLSRLGDSGQPRQLPASLNVYQPTLHAHEGAPADDQENSHGTAKSAEPTAAG